MLHYQENKQMRCFFGNSILKAIVILLCLTGLSSFAFAQSGQKQITGVVLDETGASVIGANVVEKGTANGVITDADGRFSLSVKENAMLRVSYVGYVTQEIVVGNRSSLQITLQEDAQTLEEVVVIGYGSVKKSNLTSSISKIGDDAITERPITQLSDALAGQLAGVRAQNTSGLPGEDLQIRIRGLNSINGDNNPLYVIDGVPRDNMNDLNPTDVASIQVLKDASASAIYGARGGNGVVLVETKRGKGKPTITFDGYYGLQNPEQIPGMMSIDEWRAYNVYYRNESYLRSGGSMKDPMSSRPSGYQIPDAWFSPDRTGVDWQDAILRTAPIQNYQVSASGSNDMGSIFISGGYFDQDGVILASYYNRFNFRLNATLNLGKRARVGVNLSPSFSTQESGEATGKESALHHALMQSPIINLNEGTKEWGFPDGLSAGLVYPNPVEQLKQTTSEVKKGRIFTIVWGEVDIMDGLTFRSQYSYNYDTQTYEWFQPANIVYQDYGNTSRGSSDAGKWTGWAIQNTLSYVKTFNGNELNVLLGQSADMNDTYRIYATATGWPSEDIPTLNVTTTPTRASTEKNRRTSASVFGRLSYAYKDRYLLNMSVRRDGSSRFGTNNKWGMFPAVSGGWKINEESFLKRVDWLSLLKIRASWGKAGNDRIGNYDYMARMAIENTAWNNTKQAGMIPGNIANNNLQWESIVSTDLGLDFSVLKNRLQFSFDYYINTSDKLLFNVPIPSTTGFDSYRTNLGKVENRGWEIDITSHNLDGAFKWSTSLNLSRNRNKVLDMGDIDQFTSTSWDGQFITKVGGPISQFYVYRTNGLLTEADFDADGKATVPIFSGQQPYTVKYVDQNDDGVINANDLTPWGNNLPDLMYGLTNRFSYKGLEISVLLQGQIGGDIMFLGQRQLDNASTGINTFRRWLHSYKPDYEAIYGQGENPIPTELGVDMSWDGETPYVFGSNRWQNNDDRRIYDATFLKIKNVTLAWNLPGKALKSLFAKNARVYLSVDNLKNFNSYPGATPESNSSGNTTTQQGVDYITYPVSRRFVLGVNINF
ncbi:MAG: TonB-dependent receptor [Tannerella sp.]|jgi:TonB-linked SusC/RagA family outer membrane protein|nr:TonB-dependent receptor [Tannerella sp.]